MIRRSSYRRALRLVLVAFLCSPCAVAYLCGSIHAQTVDETPVRYSVGYYRDHAFLRQDSDFTVVDTRMEWPEAVDFADVRPLLTMIDSLLFDLPIDNGEKAYADYKRRLGCSVTGQLEFLPDDRRFCYVTTVSKIKAYQPRQWLCVEIRQVVSPGVLSPVAKRDLYRILTFDLQTGRVMQTEDLLRVDRFNHLDEDSYNFVFEQLDDDRFYGLRKADVSGAWIDGKTQQVGLHIACVTDDEMFFYERTLPVQSMTSLLTREAKRMIGRKETDRQPFFTFMRQTWEGDTIYNKVDQMPTYRGGREGLSRYLSSIELFDRSQDTTAHGEAIVSFVVDKEGYVCDVHVVSPVSPVADRHAVSIIKGMPRWEPGRIRGRAVPVRLYQKLEY
jgi:hypothetical protein